MPKRKKDQQTNINVRDLSGISGEVNVAGGNIVHVENGATIVISASGEAIAGLLALGELMLRSSDVRSAVIVFEADLKLAYEQVEHLGHYKDLHALLHRLQFHCYNGIAQAAPRFPGDAVTLDVLTDYAMTLEGIGDELQQVATRLSLPTQELAWMNEVNLAKADLNSAIHILDEKSLKKVIWRLNRLLATQPSRINTLLNHAVHTLHLPVLLKGLTRVRDYLMSLDLDAARVNEFCRGIEVLSEMDQTLSQLVNGHDGWQALDVELRRIEASIERDLLELQMSWADVKPKAEPLYISYPDEWAGALKKESDELDQALSGDNPTRVRRCFHSYRRRAAERFYRVDVELKTLCDSLPRIAAPLASVLRIIA